MTAAASRLIYDTAGQPAFATATTGRLLTEHEAVCCICGQTEPVTGDADKSMGANFADRGHLRAPYSSRVCRACLWCASGKPPATLRMWSIVCAPGHTLAPSQPKAWLQDTPGLCLTNRADTRPIIDTLADPPAGPWVVTVAISGQKHVVPYADVNHDPGPWRIRVEDHTVAATPDQWAEVFTSALHLRRLGVPADAIATGEPRFVVKGGVTRDLLARWADLSAPLKPYLGSPLLDLALWTITRPIIEGTRP